MGREAGGGALWMIDKGCFGHSQEVVGSASCHMGLAAAGGGVKLQAAEAEEFCYSSLLPLYFFPRVNNVECGYTMFLESLLAINITEPHCSAAS